ncbi:MAG: hypothetical protein EOP11_21660 [Proteobacteria bacterium]|nr:MAG: hypothetical protein EOP11_21660 [Pseudomonadota bacterium]
MKHFTLLSLSFLLAACSSNSHQAKYAEEKNAPKFSNARSYVEAPPVVRIAARAVLDELNRASEPAVTGSIKGEDVLRTGWVYGVAKNRYLEFKANGKPMRKELRVRRKYGYGITPSLAGTDVNFQVEEENIRLDLKTGEELGWAGVQTDPAVYDMMAQRLTEELRQR